jgi:demethylmenaquinone methyltransferase/2-methoxy-6-polyprenyl-1,4-benzoquinol methylase
VTEENGNRVDADRVHGIFSGIADRYDLLNAVLSLGIDRSWRREAALSGFQRGARKVLDVATGTGDLAFALKRHSPAAEVTGLDFVEEMLVHARRKASARGMDISFVAGDALALPFPAASFDLVTIAYGLRNLASVSRGLFGRLYRFYFARIVPVIGGLVSGSRSAYTYLPDSVSAFLPPAVLADKLAEAGFTNVGFRLQSFGISALHSADKPDAGGT